MEIAVCIPAYNEATTIGTVVNDFKQALPDAVIYVYDNNSSDNTNEIASAYGAIVRKVLQQGKGAVVNKMLADIKADIYVMADGDNAHDHEIAPVLVKTLIRNNLDMVVGARLTDEQSIFRKGHYVGNLFFSKLVSILFSAEIKDLLSGYRVLSKPFVKSFPASSKGFEIESEMTIHCLVLDLPFLEVDTKCKCRPQGSKSKLHTASDGLRILFKIIILFKNSKPFLFFGLLSLLLFSSGAILLLPGLVE